MGDTHLETIVTGGGEVVDAEGHLQALLPLVHSLNLDSSLTSALESSCTKPDSERSTFDKLVLQELETALRSRLDTLHGIVSAGIPGLTSRAATVEGIGRELDAWQEKQKNGSSSVVGRPASCL